MNKKVNKKEDDWIDKFNKKVIGLIFNITISMVTALIVTLLLIS